MSLVEKFASLEKNFRPLMLKLPNRSAAKLFSSGRKVFLERFYKDIPKKPAQIPESAKTQLWGLDFNCPIFNAAGVFKSGDGYKVAAAQGAGAFLIGTITRDMRSGNKKNCVLHPFLPYPNSLAASNWMGLPNDGIESALEKIWTIKKQKQCPVGVSISASPDLLERETIGNLIVNFKLLEKTQVDFIELNESCPNVEHKEKKFGDLLDESFLLRLEIISNSVLKKRKRQLPVILKFSTDTQPSQVEAIVNICIDLGFDGINFGNTSTDYSFCEKFIQEKELPHFKYFTTNFGGGVSGIPLKEKSLNLCKAANSVLKEKTLSKEFHIIRTGGIFTNEDIAESKKCGVALNQWFTGYFHNFGLYGHKLYEKILTLE